MLQTHICNIRVEIRSSLRFDGIVGEQSLCVKLKGLEYLSNVLIETYETQGL